MKIASNMTSTTMPPEMPAAMAVVDDDSPSGVPEIIVEG